jgi:excisionase family DNA binding protein
MDNLEGRLLITNVEAAKLLRVSVRSLFDLTKRGEVPCIRLGRLVRYSPDELRRWIAERTGRAIKEGKDDRVKNS